MLYENEEAADLLVNLLRYAASAESETSILSTSPVQAEFPSLDEIVVEVKNASSGDALWVKMSCYPGWTASIDGENDSQLRIFQAGPNMMMVFPDKEGRFTVRFVFGKAADFQAGEAISLVSAAAILVLVVFGFLRRAWVIPEGWARTHHTGSGLGELGR